MAKVKKRKRLAEINVVPYIDVMLVLLIVFMITAPMLMQGVRVDLPRAPSEPIESQDDEPLIVSLGADGRYYLNLGSEPDSAKPLSEIVDQVGRVLRQKPETQVLVWGDRSVPYGDVVALMTELQRAGAPSVGLVTDPPEL